MFFKQISDLKNARILICNDDGIDAEGIKILEEETSKICGDVWVAAPDRQKSSSGHAHVSSMLLPRNCTSAEEVGQIKKIDDRHFAIDGTPGDCVYMALRFLFRDKHPDLLLSGVNFGRNLAEDVTYSGTIGAAMEGIIRGVPAIAFSQHMGKNARQDWDASRHFIRPLLERLTKFSFPMNTLLTSIFPTARQTKSAASSSRESANGALQRIRRNTSFAAGETIPGRKRKNPIIRPIMRLLRKTKFR